MRWRCHGKVLPCGHSLCARCLQRVGHTDGTAKCPFCKAAFAEADVHFNVQAKDLKYFRRIRIFWCVLHHVLQRFCRRHHRITCPQATDPRPARNCIALREAMRFIHALPAAPRNDDVNKKVHVGLCLGHISIHKQCPCFHICALEAPVRSLPTIKVSGEGLASSVEDLSVDHTPKQVFRHASVGCKVTPRTDTD